MNEPVKVLVHWRPEKMAHLPSSTRYITAARFPEHDAEWPEEAWSIAIEFADAEASHAPSFEATARFLVPSAPWDRLKAGRVFDLYEGRNQTATVKVL